MQYHVNLGTKVPGGIDVDLDMTNTAAVNYLVEYGLKQSLNDAIAAVKVTDADYTAANTKAKVLKRLDAILSGNVRSAGTREASDPVGVEARKLARAAFNAKPDQTRKSAMTAFRKAGITGDDKTVIAAIVEKMSSAFREQAELVVAARRSAVAELADGLDDVLAELVESE
jgi:hypothetical protein